jgi:regulator of sirC expression with transglutaminase-like and TPR domain
MMTPHDYFATLVAASDDDGQMPLTEAALSIAQDAYPDLDLAAIQIQIDKLSATLKSRLPADSAQAHRLRCLNRYFFGDLGFAVNRNDYYDPDNSYLNRVLERRIGIPISLALLYMEIGQQIGLALRGVSFPGHFLVKLRMRTGKSVGEVFIDPCDGQSLSREQLEQRMSLFPLIPALRDADPREIIIRMLRNLKSIYSQRHDFEKLLDVQKRLVIVAPDRAEERRDRGLVYAKLDCPNAALDDLNFYLQANPNAPDADELHRTVVTLQNVARPRH